MIQFWNEHVFLFARPCVARCTSCARRSGPRRTRSWIMWGGGLTKCHKLKTTMERQDNCIHAIRCKLRCESGIFVPGIFEKKNNFWPRYQISLHRTKGHEGVMGQHWESDGFYNPTTFDDSGNMLGENPGIGWTVLFCINHFFCFFFTVYIYKYIFVSCPFPVYICSVYTPQS